MADGEFSAQRSEKEEICEARCFYQTPLSLVLA